MSDQWGSGAGSGDDGADGDSRGLGGGFEPPQPPPPPPPPPHAGQPLPPVEPALTLEDSTEIKKSGSIGGRTVAAIIGVLLLVGGTLFAVTQAGGSGPGSAEAAVADLLDAVSNEDVLGLMAAIDPGEREVLRQPVEDMFTELERLEVVDDSFELTGITGIDFEFNDVTYRTEEIRPGLARVYLTGGTVTGSIDADELPIGAFVEDTLDRFGGDISGVEETSTEDINDGEEAFLVAREGADGWRVSIGYSIAEAARLDAGMPFPSPADAIEAIGAGSPEAAVEGMATALTQLDLRGMLARLSPAEFAAMHEYAGLFAGDLDDADVDEFRDAFTIRIEDLDLRSETSGNRAMVFVEGFAFSVDIDGGGRLALTYTDGCVTVEGDLEEFDIDVDEFENPLCYDDIAKSYEEAIAGFQADAEFDLPPFPDFGVPSIGITTMKVDGEWYVAPIATSLDSMVAFLRVLDRQILDDIVDFVEQAIDQFASAFSEGFSSSFEGETGFSDDFSSEFDEEFGDQFDTDDGGFGDTFGGSIDFNALDGLLSRSFPGDLETQDCMFFELIDADPQLVSELIQSYEGGPDPSPEAQQLFFDAAASCDAT